MVPFPSKNLAQAVLLRMESVRQLSHLPPQVVQLCQLCIKVDLLVVAVRFWLALDVRVNTGHGSASLDI